MHALRPLRSLVQGSPLRPYEPQRLGWLALTVVGVSIGGVLDRAGEAPVDLRHRLAHRLLELLEALQKYDWLCVRVHVWNKMKWNLPCVVGRSQSRVTPMFRLQLFGRTAQLCCLHSSLHFTPISTMLVLRTIVFLIFSILIVNYSIKYVTIFFTIILKTYPDV